MLALIPFDAIAKFGNGPGNAGWEYRDAMARLRAATDGVCHELDAWMERAGLA